MGRLLFPLRLPALTGCGGGVQCGKKGLSEEDLDRRCTLIVEIVRAVVRVLSAGIKGACFLGWFIFV
jgi:hypothetical protein